MKHILFLMVCSLVLFLGTSHAFADNQLRLTLHATGSDLAPHLSWGAWVVRPDILAHAKDTETIFSPSVFAVAGPHLSWKWKEGMVSEVWVEFLGGGALTKENFVPAGDMRAVLLSRYFHITRVQ